MMIILDKPNQNAYILVNHELVVQSRNRGALQNICNRTNQLEAKPEVDPKMLIQMLNNSQKGMIPRTPMSISDTIKQRENSRVRHVNWTPLKAGQDKLANCKPNRQCWEMKTVAICLMTGMDLGFATKGVAYFDLLFSIGYNGTPVRSPAPLTPLFVREGCKC